MLTLLACIHIRIPRAISHSSEYNLQWLPMNCSRILWNTTGGLICPKRCSSQRSVPLPALPLGLVGPLQPHVSASVPTEFGKVVGRSLWIQRRRASQNSLQSGGSARVSVASDKMITGRVVPSNTSNRILMSKAPQKTQHLCNHVLYSPMAKVRPNYETVLL